MEQVKTILDKCVSLDQLNVSKIEPSKYRLVNVPLLRAKVSVEKTEDEAPKSPEAHNNLMLKKDEMKDSSISEISTDLGPYMEGEDTEFTCDSTTPCASNSDSDNSLSLEFSTPIKPEKLRRLSYTLETPSPVLLKMMKSQGSVVIKNPSLSSTPLSVTDQKENEENRPQLSDSIFSTTSEQNGKKDDNNEEIAKIKLDQRNGNVTTSYNLNLQTSINNSNLNDSNGNSQKSESFLDDFLLQQQKMMQELLEQQAKEQDKLIHLFKEQEEQLLARLNGRNSSSSSTRRNLQQSFDSIKQSPIRATYVFQSTKLSSVIRGYLTRRLMATDRVQAIIQTIRDTTLCLKELNQGSLAILPSDVELHKRLLQQLNGAVQHFHDIFFEWEMSERMLVIARDREKKVIIFINLT